MRVISLDSVMNLTCVFLEVLDGNFVVSTLLRVRRSFEQLEEKVIDGSVADQFEEE